MVSTTGEIIMDELKRILSEWLSFFFCDNRYQVTRSEIGRSFNDAFIEFSSDSLIWRLVNDRSQVLLSCRSVHRVYKEWEWYSIDLLYRLINKKRLLTAVLNYEIAQWIKANLFLIEEKFSTSCLEQTERELKKLEKIRVKEMFG